MRVSRLQKNRAMQPRIVLSISLIVLLLLAGMPCGLAAGDDGHTVDLLATGDQSWLDIEGSGWRFENGELIGETAVFDGAKTDPQSSIFLVSKLSFGGDMSVSMDITFDVGRYVGVYVNFDQATQSGIWMATGHALSEEDKKHHVASGYIKTVENGHWIVRTTAELAVENGRKFNLRFARRGDDYSLWHNNRMIATYHKPGGYPAGQLQLRLTNAKASIRRLEISPGPSG
jgi:hypothetical protein